MYEGLTPETSLAFGANLPKVKAAIEKAVIDSFEGPGAMRNPTRRELQRRIDFCIKTAKELRFEKKWGVDRITTAIPRALRSFLQTGRPWQPNERAVWVPGDGN